MKRYSKYGILFAALMAAALLCGCAFAADTTEYYADFRENGPATSGDAETEGYYGDPDFHYQEAYKAAGIELKRPKPCGGTSRDIYLKIDAAKMEKFFKSDDEKTVISRDLLRADGSAENGIVVGIQFKNPGSDSEKMVVAETTITGGIYDGKTEKHDLRVLDSGHWVRNNDIYAYFFVTDKDGKILAPETYDVKINWYASGDVTLENPLYPMHIKVVTNDTVPNDEPSKPEDLPASADIQVVSVADMTTQPDIGYAAADTGLSEANLEKNDDGKVTVKREWLAGEAKKMYGDDTITKEKITALPVIKINNSALDYDKTLMIGFNIHGSDLQLPAGKNAKDAKLLKILSDTEAKELEFSDVISGDAGVMEGKFVIETADGALVKGTDAITATKSYMLIVFIKDNGDYDLDKDEKQVVDPLALVMTAGAPTPPTPPAPAAGDDSSGCNAGFAGMLLLLALPLIAKRKD